MKTYALEDSFMVKGEKTTAGSRILEGFRAPFDAAVVTKLREWGYDPRLVPSADEFGIGKTSPDSTASRSGASAAVADGSAAFALFNDVFGARRSEAASLDLFCVRPTYGSVSRYGLIPCAASMDQACVAARNGRDAAIALDAITGTDQRDGAMAPETFFKNRENLTDIIAERAYKAREKSPSKLRVFAPESVLASVCARVGETVKDFAEHFDRVSDFEAGAASSVFSLNSDNGSGNSADDSANNSADNSSIHFDALAPTLYILCSAEAYANTTRYDGVKFGKRASEYDGLTDLYKKTRTQGMDPDAKLASIMGSMFLASEFYVSRYERAMRLRRLISRALDFNNYDLIATPTTMTGDGRGDPFRDLSLFAPSVLAGLPSATFSYEGCGVLLTARSGRESDLFFAREAIFNEI